MSSTRFDLLIVGGGLAGASLACALRDAPLRVGLVERSPAAAEDARAYALTPANVAFLEASGVWSRLPREAVLPVERMEVAGDAGGRIAFSAYESGLPALAWMAGGDLLAEALRRLLADSGRVTSFCPAGPERLDVTDAGAMLTLADGRTLTASLVVAADGVDSPTRSLAGLSATIRPYGENGVVASFACERPHAGTAFQWFREDGVLAYLPLPGNRMSIVWSTPEAHARELLALDPEEFCTRVAQAGQERLGRLELLSVPAAFPLRWLKASAVVAPRVALIGDAAHAVHPLSGHGVNLGFADARVLADILRALPEGGDAGHPTRLHHYARARAVETVLVREGTDALHRLFGWPFLPAGPVRNAGMSLAGSFAPLRSLLARCAAGLW